MRTFLRGFARICADLRGFARICADLRGFARICAVLRGFARVCVGFKADLVPILKGKTENT